jgi:ABC-type nickel/cobalt efflux system permease component RcnA
LIVLVALAAPGARAVAHPLGNFTINHLSRIAVSGDALTLRYIVDFAEIPAFAEQRSMNPRGVMTTAERARWAAAQAQKLADALHLTVDGAPIPLVPGTATALARPGAGGLSTLYLTVAYHATLPKNANRFVYRDDAFPNRTGWRDAILAGEREPTDELRSYPSALIGSPPDRTVAAFTRAANGTLARTDAAQPAAPAAQAGSASLARSDELSDMLVRNDASIGFFLALFGLAIFLGAMHAIEPGHGKTLMAVSLVGARATVQQAAILAAAITVAHTAGVIALGLVILCAAKYIVPEQIYPWITLGSGVVVAILAARSLARFVEARRPRLHAHAHAHPSAREHAHEHAHGIGAHDHHAPHEHERHDPAEFNPAAAARAAFAAHGHDHATMTDDEHARAHAIPGTAALGFGSVVAAAMTGGIAPCPAALVVLLTAVNVHKIGLGLLLIVAFSFGLAAVLVGIGIAVVRGASLLARSSRFKLFTQYGPLFSASIIALIGAGMIGEGLVAQGVGGTPILFAALALLAIVGYAFGSHTHAHAPRVAA